MPVIGSCKVATAAACYLTYSLKREKEYMVPLPVQREPTLVGGPIGHCSFHSGDEFPPENGKECGDGNMESDILFKICMFHHHAVPY